MKVGDLVRWSTHEAWQHAGLGTIVEVDPRGVTRRFVFMHRDAPELDIAYRIMWHVDIEDIPGYKGTWYTSEDFDDGTIVKV